MDKILTVDDSPSIRKMIMMALTKEGYDVSEAEGGTKALEIVKERKFDLILLDYNMPEMDGITLLKILRTLPEYTFTPIIIVSTESNKQFKEASKEAGVTGWVKKPFDPEKLLKVIKRVLG
ncbi:MAG: response regulator [Gammaproteobacteria bacterium]|nr:MAG: response regulator [Gammaproteobacteria bacterium]